MADILMFPKKKQQHIYLLDHCAGCGYAVTGDYWEVTIPLATHAAKHIALCDDCNEEVIKQGVSL